MPGYWSTCRGRSRPKPEPLRDGNRPHANGLHYLDLADDPAFVAGIGALDVEAKAAGVFVLSEASTYPVLVEAAMREMASAFTVIKDVEAGIAPSPRVRVGRNVLRAISAMRAGRRTSLKRDD